MTATSEVDVAVIGAAGGTGQPLVAALTRRGASVRAIVHRPEQGALMPRSAEVVALELADVATLTQSLRGAKVVHFIPPVFNEAEERYARNIIAAAEAASVGRLTYHSVLHAYTPEMPHHARKARVEVLIRASALPWTILQPAMYMQTPLRFLNAEAGALTPGFDVNRFFTPVDLQDLADVTAMVLTEDGHDYATYELAGPSRLTFVEMAETLSAILGRAVAAKAVPATALVDALGAQLRFTPAAGIELKAMLDHYDHHGLSGNGRVLAHLLGRPATSPADAFARELAAAA